jgi:propanol-preferring alcohol dehydrogenase
VRAAVLREYGRPLDVCEVPDPVPGPNDALVRVRAAGVCATDLTIRAGGLPAARPPRIPGHEIAGEVVTLGTNTGGVGPRVGDHVIVCYYLTCGACGYCRTGRDTLCERVRGRVGVELDGGFAELVAVPTASLFPVGEAVGFDAAAVLADAGAASWHALRRQGQLVAGERVIVVGAGGLGLIAIQLARLVDAHPVAVDVSDEKLAAARDAGAEDVALSSTDWPAALGPADLVLDLVGKPETIEASLRAVRPDGRVVLVSYGAGENVTVAPRSLITAQLRVIGSRGSYKTELADVIRFTEEGSLRPVVGRSYPLAAINEALDALAAGTVLGRATVCP